jgi:hypothetical protein
MSDGGLERASLEAESVEVILTVERTTVRRLLHRMVRWIGDITGIVLRCKQ